MPQPNRKPRPTTGTFATVLAVHAGSDGEATMRLYSRLRALGPAGMVAVDVFRAHKASTRAKVYRGGQGGQSYRSMAYEKKAWAIGNLVKALGEHAEALGLRWGWAVDLQIAGPHHHILYIDLPTGQVSWHGAERGPGPDYPDEWDGERGMGAERICRWVARMLDRVEAVHGG